MGLLKKLTGIGPGPEVEKRQKEEKQLLEQIRQEKEFEGRKIGIAAAARSKGIREGRRQGSGSSGILGTFESTLSGLNRMESALGFNDMLGAGPGPDRKQRKRKKETNPFFDF